MPYHMEEKDGKLWKIKIRSMNPKDNILGPILLEQLILI